jgi:hypothetical protein
VEVAAEFMEMVLTFQALELAAQVVVATEIVGLPSPTLHLQDKQVQQILAVVVEELADLIPVTTQVEAMVVLESS